MMYVLMPYWLSRRLPFAALMSNLSRLFGSGLRYGQWDSSAAGSGCRVSGSRLETSNGRPTGTYQTLDRCNHSIYSNRIHWAR